MVALASTDETQYQDEALVDYSMEPAEAQRDLRYAQMAVVIHQGEDWPAGRVCRNCHAPFPCRLARWGGRVLTLVGWTPLDVAYLLERAKAGEVPW